VKKQHLFIFFLSVLFLSFGAIKASAAEMSFSVQAIIPDNQVDKSQSYFDLRMSPGQAQDLTVEMRNDTAEAVTVNVLPNTAITNQNGIVEYNNTSTARDSTLKTSFKEIATTDKEVSIPAKSKKQIKVHVQMPTNSYDGVVLGGLYFTEKAKPEENKDKGSQIVNRYAYVIGVKLTETDTVVNPDLKLTSVQAKQVNYRNVIAANIQNTQSALLKDLSIEGKVYTKGGKNVLYSTKRDNLRMAPNSNFDFGISLNNKPFKPGKYTFKGTAKSGKQTWTFEKDFEIKGETAKTYNKQAVSLKKDYTWIYLLIGLVIFLILLLVIIILIRKLKAEKAQKN
jgi:hypothetical protein